MIQKIFYILIIITISSVCRMQADEITVIFEKENSGQIVAKNTFKFTDKSRDELFGRSLVSAHDLANGKEDQIESIDVENQEIVFVKSIYNGKGSGKLIDNNKATFRFSTNVRVGQDDILYIIFDDLWITYKDKGIIQKTVPLHKLKEDNKRHKDLIKEMTNIMSSFLREYIEVMETTDYKPITNWQALSNGKIVKGMNDFEVKLILGVPPIINKNGNQEKWRYSNDKVIVFNNGIVTSVVN